MRFKFTFYRTPRALPPGRRLALSDSEAQPNINTHVGLRYRSAPTYKECKAGLISPRNEAYRLTVKKRLTV